MRPDDRHVTVVLGALFAAPLAVTLLVLLWNHDDSAPVLGDAGGDGIVAPSAAPVETGLQVVILFSQLTRGVVHLDCVVAAGPGCGWPITLTACVPFSGPWAIAVERTLGCWARDSTPVLVEPRPLPSPGRLRFSDGDTAIVLDATHSASMVSRPPGGIAH